MNHAVISEWLESPMNEISQRVEIGICAGYKLRGNTTCKGNSFYCDYS